MRRGYFIIYLRDMFKLKEKIVSRMNAIPRRYLMIGLVSLVLVVFGAGTVASYYFLKVGPASKNTKAAVTQGADDKYALFLDEIWDKIKENYWDKIKDEDLGNLYKLGAEKLMGKPQTLETANKDGVNKMLAGILKDMGEAKKKEFSSSLADIVLANLKPFGRSRLYTTKQQQSLSNTVQNINPDKNLYSSLGLDKGATQKQVDAAFAQKAKELGKDKTAEGQQKLKDLAYAHEVLSNSGNKNQYDQSGIEPTVFTRILGNAYYLHITKVSPTTLEEFQKAVDATTDKKNLNTLILDLRGNIGGAIDIMPYFLGPFIGPNQYAFDFFHQGDYNPYRTKTGWLASLVKFKKVIVLIDGQAQSSAEIMAAVLKKYNVGILIGEHTKGWGTVEKVFDINHQIDPAEKFSALMVHSLTLRDDNQPIEGRGVDPTINIKDKNWQKQLLEYYNYPEVVRAVKEMWDNPIPAQ